MGTTSGVQPDGFVCRADTSSNYYVDHIALQIEAVVYWIRKAAEMAMECIIDIFKFNPLNMYIETNLQYSVVIPR